MRNALIEKQNWLLARFLLRWFPLVRQKGRAMRLRLVKAVLAVGMILATAGASVAMAGVTNPGTLAYLVETQGSLTVNDKLFSNWTATNMGIANNIFITPLADGGLDPGPGLLYNINPAFAIDAAFFDELSFGFSFRVDVVDPSLRIKDYSLQTSLSGFFIDDESDFSEVRISEAVRSLSDTVLGGGVVGGYCEDFGEECDGALLVSGSFAPQSAVKVNMNLEVAAEFGVARITSFEQRFSQVSVPTGVPEPATLALLGLGLAGLAASRRRKQ